MNRYKAMMYAGCFLAVFLVIEIIIGIYNKKQSDDYQTIAGSTIIEEVEEVEEDTPEPTKVSVPENINYEPVKIIIYRHGSVGITQYGEVVMLN
jgi:hypothetical protein